MLSAATLKNGISLDFLTCNTLCTATAYKQIQTLIWQVGDILPPLQIGSCVVDWYVQNDDTVHLFLAKYTFSWEIGSRTMG